MIILSEMVSSDSNSINSHLAAYILQHLDEIKTESVRDLAAKTHVSISSISRFCRDIGLNDYAELKDCIGYSPFKFDICSDSTDSAEQKSDYIRAVKDSLDLVCESVNMDLLNRLAQDIYDHENVYIFGVMKGETAAMNLQSDLSVMGKHAVTKLRYAQQLQCLERCGPDDLVILFSFTGKFFDYGYPKLPHLSPMEKPKLYFITSDPKILQNRKYGEVIWFKSLQTQPSHPYQMQVIAGLITQCYLHLLHQKDKEKDDF